MQKFLNANSVCNVHLSFLKHKKMGKEGEEYQPLDFLVLTLMETMDYSHPELLQA